MSVPAAASEPGSDDLGLRYPNGARIWNYHLRGKDNFAIDRQAAETVEAIPASLRSGQTCANRSKCSATLRSAA